MHCPFCNYTDTKVIDSRLIAEGSQTRRRRECESCSHRFTTYEYILPTPVMVIKKNGLREEYDRKNMMKKLFL